MAIAMFGLGGCTMDAIHAYIAADFEGGTECPPGEGIHGEWENFTNELGHFSDRERGVYVGHFRQGG